MVELGILHDRIASNICYHIIFDKRFFYDITDTQQVNSKINEVEPEKIFITSYFDETLDRHPFLDKIFQLFLRYLFGWFSIVDYYMK